MVNARLCADKNRAGSPGAMPDPLNWTICGLPAAVSVRVSDPAFGPRAEGVNDRVMTQLERGAMPGPQSFVCEKAGPTRTMLLISTGAVEGFVNVNVRLGLVVPI